MHAICNEIRLFYNTNSWQKVSISGKVHQSASYRPIPLCSAAFNELIKCKSKLAHSYALTLLSISWWGMHHQNRQVVWGRSELRSFWIACSLLIPLGETDTADLTSTVGEGRDCSLHDKLSFSITFFCMLMVESMRKIWNKSQYK